MLVIHHIGSFYFFIFLGKTLLNLCLLEASPGFHVLALGVHQENCTMGADEATGLGVRGQEEQVLRHLETRTLLDPQQVQRTGVSALCLVEVVHEGSRGKDTSLIELLKGEHMFRGLW